MEIPGLQLIIAILPERAEQIYPEIKRVRDNLMEFQRSVSSQNTYSVPTPQLCANIALKINSKSGGINHVIDPGEKSLVFQEPVIIFGDDVTYPSPTENGIPSILLLL